MFPSISELSVDNAANDSQVFNNALHSCCMLLVTRGGFGFHTVDILRRFGPDTVKFFFKVRNATSLEK